MNKLQSRREFLKTTGKLAAGVALVSAVNPVLSAVAEEKPKAPEYPFTYTRMDPEKVKEHAYKCFYEYGGCCAGAFGGVLDILAEEVGYPFNQFPARMYANGAGGYGAASLCGSLGGCAAVIGMFMEAKDARAVTAELFKWYRKHEFPAYDPEKYAAKKTVADSVNCADSVTKFMKENGIKEMSDPVRMSRCAAVTGEAAAKTVELLNAHFNL